MCIEWNSETEFFDHLLGALEQVGAAESVLLVHVDGRPVGVSKDSHLAAEFDLIRRDDFEALKAEVAALREEVAALKAKKTPAAKKAAEKGE